MSRIFKSYESSRPKVEKRVIALKPIERETTSFDLEDGKQTNERIETMLIMAENEAASVVKRANDEATHIRQKIAAEIQAWDEEKRLMTEEAQAAGFAAGHEEGQARGYEEMRGLIQLGQEVVAASKRDYEEKIVAAEAVIVELGIKVAEKIVDHALEKDDELFSSIVKKVLKEVREDSEVQIHVHPAHYELVLSQKEELLNVFPGETSLYIYPDDDLAELDCYIESENGRVDASIDSQLAEVKQKLFELLESGSE